MFVIDTNIIIQGQENYYPAHNFPSFWGWILNECKKGNLIFIDQVIAEAIKDKKAIQYQWVKDNVKILQTNYNWCVKTEEAEIENTQNIMSANGNYLQDFFEHKPKQNHQRFKDDFLKAADFYLVSYAQANDYTVVTYEHYDLSNRKKILIPNYCSQEGIKYNHPKEMFKKLGLKI